MNEGAVWGRPVHRSCTVAEVIRKSRFQTFLKVTSQHETFQIPLLFQAYDPRDIRGQTKLAEANQILLTIVR
jgi:hypothetical protein